MPVREMAATTKEMDMARLHRSQRDYCAHAYMQLFKCKRDWAPESWRCKREVDALAACQHDDGFHRKLEYERDSGGLLKKAAGKGQGQHQQHVASGHHFPIAFRFSLASGYYVILFLKNNSNVKI